MSKVQRDAYHAARLLQNELTRLDSKRVRSISNANAAFQLDLREAIVGAERSTLTLVRQVLREDVTHQHLSQALEVVLETLDEDGHERQTDAPDALEQPRREHRESSLPPPPAQSDGNLDWGLPPAPRLPGAIDVVETDGLAAGYRYPEPGEPATQLPDGTVVALDGAPA